MNTGQRFHGPPSQYLDVRMPPSNEDDFAYIPLLRHGVWLYSSPLCNVQSGILRPAGRFAPNFTGIYKR